MPLGSAIRQLLSVHTVKKWSARSQYNTIDIPVVLQYFHGNLGRETGFKGKCITTIELA